MFCYYEILPHYGMYHNPKKDHCAFRKVIFVNPAVSKVCFHIRHKGGRIFFLILSFKLYIQDIAFPDPKAHHIEDELCITFLPPFRIVILLVHLIASLTNSPAVLMSRPFSR